MNICSVFVKSAPMPGRTQPRGARRRDALLDATARLLDARGYDGVNTNAIAAEAGVAVGTVYHHFPDKQALLGALLERYGARLFATVAATVAAAQGRPLDDLVDAGVRAFAAFYLREPGYAQLWLSAQLTGPLREAGEQWGARFGDEFGALFSETLGLPKARAREVALAFVHAVSAVVTVAVARPDKRARASMIREAVRVGQGYLRAVHSPRPRSRR